MPFAVGAGDVHVGGVARVEPMARRGRSSTGPKQKSPSQMTMSAPSALIRSASSSSAYSRSGR